MPDSITNAMVHSRSRRPGPIDNVLGNSLLLGLIGFWTMDEASGTRSDANGTNHLAAAGTVTSAAGKINDAAVFASGANHLSVGGSLLPAVAPRSISLWVYPTDVAAERGCASGGTSYNSGTPLWIIRYRASGTGPFSVFHGGAARNGTTVPVVNTWYHVVYTFDGSSAVTLWVNGTQEGTFTVADTNGSTHIYFGNTFNAMIGRIDEAGAWNRVLTSMEITRLYNNGNGVTYPSF
jgi:hypothetical protein